MQWQMELGTISATALRRRKTNKKKICVEMTDLRKKNDEQFLTLVSETVLHSLKVPKFRSYLLVK
jgi:hypothetical protein